MDLFGENWENHHEKIASSWDASIAQDDLVLIAGDISWAMRLKEALPDLEWIDQRPGTKVLVRGNHDYWWESLKKVREALPKSIHVIQNDCLTIGDVAIAGTRLWESAEFSFDELIDFTPGPKPPVSKNHDNEALFIKELGRLERSLQQMPEEAKIKIAMTHYPPIGNDLAPSKASELFEHYGVCLSVFGHLHSFKPGLPPLFGNARGVEYALTSCDWLGFSPICLIANS